MKEGRALFIIDFLIGLAVVATCLWVLQWSIFASVIAAAVYFLITKAFYDKF